MMDDDTTTRVWLEQSKPYLVSLSEAIGLSDQHQVPTPTIEQAESINRTLRSWQAANPASNRELSDRLHLLAARYGYVVLVEAPDRAPHDATKVPLSEQLTELNRQLETLLSDVEQLSDRIGLDAHSAKR